MCGAGLLAQAAGNPVADSLVQYGALGLCAFMVWQTYRMIDRLGKTNKEQFEKLDELHARTLEADREVPRSKKEGSARGGRTSRSCHRFTCPTKSEGQAGSVFKSTGIITKAN